MVEELRITLLGSPSVTLGDEPVSGFVSNKARALIYYLAATGQPHTRDTLAGLLWSDVPDATAKRNLRDVLSNLRQLVGPYLHITRQTVSLNKETPQVVDSERFSARLASSWRAELSTTPPTLEDMTSLSDGVDLYLGEFLAGFYVSEAPLFEEWVLEERERLRQELDSALEHLVRGYIIRGELKPAISYAHHWLALDPLREAAHRYLMQLYTWDGDRAAALRQYEACVQILSEDLGVEPAPETTALYDLICADELKARVPEPEERTIRGYKLYERIGQGNFGAVYRAYQPQVDREVAIKVILPQHANHPDFIRRFEAEAQLVARLEHPHIVPLYDYWREPNGAYLVMRWLRGGSLGDALRQGPWEPEAATQLVDQIAAALATAHRQDVVHRDIKPANILLDQDNNGYLSDFGIARDVGNGGDPSQPGVLSSSPAYTAPEQIQGKQISSLADIYSLGVVLFELLTGQHPFPTESVSTLVDKHLHEPLPPLQPFRLDLPTAVNAVIQQATAKHPTERFSDALILADAFRRALTTTVSLPIGIPLAEPTNPYKGLRPFLEADTADFFGRSALTEQLVARLAPSPSEGEGRFLAVVGPSGSGKSSVVRAGMIPALRRGALPGSEDWFVTQMQPGDRPFEELEIALLHVATDPPTSLLDQLREDEGGLLQAVEHTLPDDDSELVLFIDQFEELFTLVQDETERTQFLKALFTAVTDPHSRLRVVITLRADFYDRPLQYTDLGELVRQHTQVVLPLSSAELERAITGPAERVGITIEPGLVAEIVTDVTDQPGGLPLLQYALTELFEQRDGNTITQETYHAIGGALGALGHRAEELYQELDTDSQDAAHQLFLRLVTLGEGTGSTSTSPYTRRRVLRTELAFLEVERGAMETAINTFGHHRLLTFDRDPATRAPTVEIAHEALLREWDRLREWLEDSRADVRTERLLAAAMLEWEEANREPSYLLRGARLAQFEGWAEESAVALTQDEAIYLEASIAAREARQAEEETRRQRELETARKLAETEKQRAEEQTYTAQRMRRRAVFLTIALTVAGALAVVAILFGRQASEKSRIATSRELAAAATANLDEDPERSTLLALRAVEETYLVDQTVLPEAEEALHAAVQAVRVQFAVPGWGPLAISPDGTRLATSVGDDEAKIWDATTGEELLTLSGHTDIVAGVAFSPDGTRLATTSGDRTAKVWDISTTLNAGVATGRELLTLPHKKRLHRSAFSPDGTGLATSSDHGPVVVWDMATGEELLSLEQPDDSYGVTFSPDGTRLATTPGDVAIVWDASSGEQLFVLEGHSVFVVHVVFSPDGDRLATAGWDGTAKIWDATTGEELLTLFGHTGVLGCVEFSPDGTRVATSGGDGTARVYDAETGQELLTLVGHTAAVANVVFSPDGRYLTTSSDDGTTRVWDISTAGSREKLTLPGQTGWVGGLAFSPDGKWLAVGSDGNVARVWNVATGEELFRLEGHADIVLGVSFSPDGKWLATASGDNTAKLWDMTTGEELLTLDGHTNWVWAAAFSPDGTRLATASEDTTIKMWDIATGKELFTSRGHSGIVWSIAFSPDGTRLASSSLDMTARIWDAATGEQVLTLKGHTWWVIGAFFSPDGTRLATGSSDGTVRVWDTTTGEELLSIEDLTGRIDGTALSSDGTRLATGGEDATVSLWDAATGRQLLTLTGHRDSVGMLTFSPDGKLLATSSVDGTVRVYVLSIEDLMALARERVTRSLTDEECRQYLHVEQCPDNP